MKANGLVQSNNGQVWFAFVSEPEAGGCQRSEVQSLKRFNVETILEGKGRAFAFGELAPIDGSGALRETTLNRWLEFFTPLCSRGN